MKFGLLVILLAFASEKKENKVESEKSEERFEENTAENLILVKIEEDECTKEQKNTSQYIGVSYSKDKTSNWRARRWSKNENKMVYNGSYKNEETAAHASDTLARKLIKHGEYNHKLNFPDDDTEVNAKKEKTSEYIGVSYIHSRAEWSANRWSKMEQKTVYNGNYKDEKAAAHASDTFAKKLMKNGEQNHKLNFPEDNTEVYPKKKNISSKYIGVSYCENKKRWFAQRWDKKEKTNVYNGLYKDEVTAALASDTLARKLMKNGEQNYNLNFPDDNTEVNAKYQRNKRKRSDHENLKQSQDK